MNLALELWSDPRVTRFITARGRLTESEVREWLTLEIDREKKFGVQYWPVFLKSTHEHVGCCGLRPYQLANRIYEIGFHIHADRWRQGYASEAARGVMRYAFDTLFANALFAGHHPQNAVSSFVLLKLGFTYEGDEYYAPTGLMHPSYRLSGESYRRQFPLAST